MRQSFKFYLLNETNSHLNSKIGDILSALQSLHEDAPHLSNQLLTRLTKNLTNEIRKVLKSGWQDSDKELLYVLQKVGVAFAKALSNDSGEKSDIKELVANAVQELEQASGRSKDTTNDLGSVESEDAEI